MFVAVTIKNGKAVFCKNPVETTEKLEDAFTFSTMSEARTVLAESKEFYNLNASAIEVLEEPQVQQNNVIVWTKKAI